jgi:hypothetical protein
MSRLLCEVCGRPGAEREVYCGACGNALPGRRTEPAEVAPPGWLMASERGEAAPVFEPLPTVPLRPPADPRETGTAWPGEATAPAAAILSAVAIRAHPGSGGPGWNVRAATGVPSAAGVDEPAPPPHVASTSDGAAVATPLAPPLRALYAPLLAVIVASTLGAALLLALHVLLER